MAVFTAPFGRTKEGEAVTAYRLENSAGMSVTVLDYGATIQSIAVPNRSGGFTDVALGYDTVEEYEAGDGYLGATIGRVGNRIAGARFDLGGVTYTLAKNDGENHLHGGTRGFDAYIWQAQVKGESAVVFSRLSPDGEENYPGNLKVSVTFTLTQDNALSIAYDAVSDKDTLLNLTNHTYFNLNGGGDVLAHELQICAERFCEATAQCIPTGRLLPVEGTPMDFRTPKPIGRDIRADWDQLRYMGGYDHNFVLTGGKTAAVVYSPASGVEMTVRTDLPGVQLYTANSLGERTGKGGSTMGRWGALCLETQLYPDGVNHYGFPSPVLHAGEAFHSETVYRFAVR